MADLTSNFEQADIDSNKVMAIVAWIIWLVPLIVNKESRFVKFHTNQALVLCICYVVAWILSAVLTNIFFAFGLIFVVIYLLLFVLWIMGIIGAISGKAKPLPIIGGITLIKY